MQYPKGYDIVRVPDHRIAAFRLVILGDPFWKHWRRVTACNCRFGGSIWLATGPRRLQEFQLRDLMDVVILGDHDTCG